MDDTNLIDEAYDKAVEVLRMNVTPIGFSASTEKFVNYYSVWARDHSICSIAAVLTGDRELIKTAKKGIIFLLQKQADHGQVPTYVEIENKKKNYGGLGVITSVDSNLWIPIIIAFIHKKTGDKRFLSYTNMVRYQKFYRLFKAFDSNDCGLLEIPIAGDWADVFGREYHILYDQCLYYLSLKSLLYLFKEGNEKIEAVEALKKIRKRIRWISNRITRVKKRVNEVLWFKKDNIPSILAEYMIYDKVKIKDYDYYQSYIMPFKMYWQRRFASFGNVMAMISKIANKSKRDKIIDYVYENNIAEPFAVKSLYPPIYKSDRDWETIYSSKMTPYNFANGGVWPVIGGFWIYALAHNENNKKALYELNKMAEWLKKNNWRFHEYANGKTGKAKGRTYQAWSAAGYIIAYQAVKNKEVIF